MHCVCWSLRHWNGCVWLYVDLWVACYSLSFKCPCYWDREVGNCTRAPSSSVSPQCPSRREPRFAESDRWLLYVYFRQTDTLGGNHRRYFSTRFLRFIFTSLSPRWYTIFHYEMASQAQLKKQQGKAFFYFYFGGDFFFQISRVLTLTQSFKLHIRITKIHCRQ